MEVSKRVFHKLWLPFIIVVAFLIFLWVYSHSVIVITVRNLGGGNVHYSLLNQTTQKNINIDSNAGSISRVVPRGKYTVIVSQNEKSYFSLVKTGALLAKSRVTAILSPEKQRIYVGDNPASCMYYVGVLFSYECGSSYNSINQHVPATLSTPTYTQSIPSSGIEGLVEGLIKTKEGTIVLVHPGDIDGPGIHQVYLVDKNLNIIKQQALDNLDSGSGYSITNYKSGFLIYDLSFKQLLYYSAVGAMPNKINIDKPHESSLSPVSLTTDGTNITIGYSESSSDAFVNNSVGIKNEIINYDGIRSGDLVVNGQPITSAVSCGKNMICVLFGNKTMEVYGVARSEKLFSVNGVNAMSWAGDSLIIARNNDVLNLNTNTLSGSTDYTYGAYHYCGFQPVDSMNYLLCMSTDSKRVELLIGRGSDNKDSIDKKIQQLEGISEVNTISVYKNHIFISPNQGPLIYSSSENIFSPDPSAENNANNKINAKIDSLGINQIDYNIVL